MTTAQSAELRRRARHLVDLAVMIEHTPALELHQQPLDETWRGARPLLCENLLTTNRRQIAWATEDLRRQAWSFRERADELDLSAAVQGRLAG